MTGAGIRSAGGMRGHPAYFAFLGHRLSGLGLALFLPFHFLTLGLALEGADGLDAFLSFAEHPVMKFGEWGLVVLLALHLGFGLRLLALELAPWPRRDGARLSWIGYGTGAALLAGAIFLARAF